MCGCSRRIDSNWTSRLIHQFYFALVDQIVTRLCMLAVLAGLTVMEQNAIQQNCLGQARVIHSNAEVVANGSRLVRVGNHSEPMIEVFDMQTKACLWKKIFHDHATLHFSSVVSSDGMLIAVNCSAPSRQGMAYLIDASNGNVIYRSHGTEFISFSNIGDWIVGIGNQVCILRIKERAIVSSIVIEGNNAIVSKDSSKLLVLQESSAKGSFISTLKLIDMLTIEENAEHARLASSTIDEWQFNEPIVACRISDDSRFIAVQGRNSNQLRVFEVGLPKNDAGPVTIPLRRPVICTLNQSNFDFVKSGDEFKVLTLEVDADLTEGNGDKGNLVARLWPIKSHDGTDPEFLYIPLKDTTSQRLHVQVHPSSGIALFSTSESTALFDLQERKVIKGFDEVLSFDSTFDRLIHCIWQPDTKTGRSSLFAMLFNSKNGEFLEMIPSHVDDK